MDYFFEEFFEDQNPAEEVEDVEVKKFTDDLEEKICSYFLPNHKVLELKPERILVLENVPGLLRLR